MSTPRERPDAGRVYRRYLSAVLLHGHASARACGLGATDLYALNILELTGPLTPGELGARAGLTTGPTTRLIDRLEQAGYVRRVPAPDDRRKVIVEPIGKPAQLDQVLDLLAVMAHEEIGDPGRGGRLAQGLDLGGQGAVAVRTGLLLVGGARRHELLGRQAVELVGDLVDVHVGTVPRGVPPYARRVCRAVSGP